MKKAKCFIYTACCVLSLAVTGTFMNVNNKAVSEDDYGDTVILLHGLGRTSTSMMFLQSKLQQNGFHVENINYPSTDLSIEQIAERYLAPVVQRSLKREVPIHFVTHSMGGIIVRKYLSEYSPMYIGRIVMLAPPNLGSEIIDQAQKYETLKKVLGPAAMQLSTSPDSLVNTLGAIDYPTGIIAGQDSFNPLSSHFIRGTDDGKVSVKNTKLQGMKDHIVVDASHTFIMNKGIVIEHILNFLKTGKFIDKQVAPL